MGPFGCKVLSNNLLKAADSEFDFTESQEIHHISIITDATPKNYSLNHTFFSKQLASFLTIL